MRVHAVPATVTVAPEAQLADVVFADDRVNADLVLFQRRSAGSWLPVTARQFAADVRALAAGFLSFGIQPPRTPDGHLRIKARKGRTHRQHLSALRCWQQAGHAENGNRLGRVQPSPVRCAPG